MARNAAGSQRRQSALDPAQDALLEKYVRLRRAAEQVIDETQAVGNRDHPMAGIPAHVLRDLRRELSHPPEPQPNGMLRAHLQALGRELRRLRLPLE
jgi:hypothetical protein